MKSGLSLVNKFVLLNFSFKPTYRISFMIFKGVELHNSCICTLL